MSVKMNTSSRGYINAHFIREYKEDPEVFQHGTLGDHLQVQYTT